MIFFKFSKRRKNLCLFRHFLFSSLPLFSFIPYCRHYLRAICLGLTGHLELHMILKFSASHPVVRITHLHILIFTSRSSPNALPTLGITSGNGHHFKILLLASESSMNAMSFLETSTNLYKASCVALILLLVLAIST